MATRNPTARYVDDPLGFLFRAGPMFEFNRRCLHPRGYTLITDVTGWSLLDNTDNPVTVFDSSAFLVGQKKFREFMEATERAARIRQERLGFNVQKVPDYRKQRGF